MNFSLKKKKITIMNSSISSVSLFPSLSPIARSTPVPNNFASLPSNLLPVIRSDDEESYQSADDAGERIAEYNNSLITDDLSSKNTNLITDDLSSKNSKKNDDARKIEKIDVDKEKLAKTPYDDVIEAKQWGGLANDRHMGIVGASTAGKTTFFKTLLADQKIPICDVYIVVGDSPGKSEIVTGFCTLEYLTNGSFSGKKFMHFSTSEIEKAFAYAIADENINTSKCLFLSDCLITSAKTKERTANFMNRAKNYKTSVIVEIHHLAGESMVLMRNALAVIVYLDQSTKSLARALDMAITENTIQKYSGLSKYERVLIHDKQEGIFNKHYLPF